VAGVPAQRRLVGLVLAVLLVPVLASEAGARPDRVGARTTGRGVEVAVERFTPGRRTTAPGVGPGRTAARPAAPACSLFPWIFDPGTAKGGIPPTPAHRRFIVSCGGQAVGTRWIGPADPLAAIAARAAELAAVAERVVREIAVGGMTIGRRPQGRGLTGVPTYVWVAGYDGRPVTRTVHALGATVDVRITLRHTTWDFGDGTPPTLAGLGQAWPRRSDVHHTYEVATPHDAPRTIAATVTFFAEHRVDGGPWQALAPLTRSATTAIDVDQVQAVRRR
jgi:hypothetical protein